jgi:hypothetical protein
METSTKQSKTFRLRSYDSWSGGLRYWLEEVNEENEQDFLADINFEIPQNEQVDVYLLTIDIGQCDSRLLQTFSNETEATTFAKQQFFLATGNYPFISLGDNKGHRPVITIPEGMMPCVEPDCLVDDQSYALLIMSKDTQRVYALNATIIWGYS